MSVQQAQQSQLMSNISAGGSALADLTSSYFQSLQLKSQARETELQRKRAKLKAQIDNGNLLRKYNQTMSKQATMFAGQGRSFSSGSIKAILSKQEEDLNWEKRFMELTGDIQDIRLRTSARGFRTASKIAMSRGLVQFQQKIGQQMAQAMAGGGA